MHHCWHWSGACRRGTRVFRIGIHGRRGWVALRRRGRLIIGSRGSGLWVVIGRRVINLRLRLLHTLSVVHGVSGISHSGSGSWHCYWLVRWYRWRLRLRSGRRGHRRCSIGWLGGHRIAYGRVSCNDENGCILCQNFDKLDERWYRSITALEAIPMQSFCGWVQKNIKLTRLEAELEVWQTFLVLLAFRMDLGLSARVELNVAHAAVV